MGPAMLSAVLAWTFVVLALQYRRGRVQYDHWKIVEPSLQY